MISRTALTGFSDVMSVIATGERTFFHHRGANAEFSPSDIDLSQLNCKMLHIGYILLLDRFDAPHTEHGTVMASFLRDAQERQSRHERRFGRGSQLSGNPQPQGGSDPRRGQKKARGIRLLPQSITQEKE